jgi:O-antigen/teichoic acid export membrane protein
VEPSGREKTPRVVTNIVWNWANYGLSILAALYITPLLIERLGDTSYGLWVLLSAIVGYYGLLNFGIDFALVHYISRYLADGRRQEIARMIATGRVIFRFIAITVLFASVGLAAAFAYSDWVIFPLSETLRHPFSILLIVLSIGMAASFLTRVFVSILRATERYDILNAVSMVVLVGRTLAIIFLMGDSLLALGSIFAISNVVSSLCFFVLARRLFPPDEKYHARFDRVAFGKVRRYGFFFFLNSLAEQARFHADAVVIGLFMRINYITYYNLANVLITYFRNIVGNASSPFLPVFSRHHGAQDELALRRVFLQATKFLAFLTVLAGGNILGSALPFLKLWVGHALAPEYVLLSHQVLMVLLLPFTIELTQSIAASVIYGTGQHHRLAALNGLEGAANLLLSLLLIQRYGIIGVALGTAIPLLITRLFFIPRLVGRLTGIDLLPYIRTSIGVPIMCGAVLGVFQRFIYQRIGADTYGHLISIAGLTSIAFALAMARFYFSGEDRALFTRIWRSWRGGGSP